MIIFVKFYKLSKLGMSLGHCIHDITKGEIYILLTLGFSDSLNRFQCDDRTPKTEFRCRDCDVRRRRDIL